MIKIYYCKGKKSEGTPIVVEANGKQYFCRGISLKNVDISMSFNNSCGVSKRSGATTILEVEPHKEIDIERLLL